MQGAVRTEWDTPYRYDRVRALEDVDFNNAELDEIGGKMVYCAYPNEETEESPWNT